MEQYANDRGSDRGVSGEKPSEAETLLAFVRSMETANLPAFYARKQLLLSVRLSHRNSACPSVRHTGGSVKNGTN